MNNSNIRLRLDNLTVKFAWLHTPDTKFDPNFSVTVALTDEVKAKLSAVVKQLGGSKANGVRTFTDSQTGEGEKVIKFTNKILLMKENAKSFQCVDSAKNPCDAAMGGDVVNVALTAKKLDRDGTVSFFLDGVQLVKKNSNGGGGSNDPFDTIEGGYSAASAPAPQDAFEDDAPEAAADPVVAEDDDDLPF